MLVFSMQLTPLLLAGFYFIFGLFYSIGNANVMTSGLSEVSPEFKPDGNAIFNTCLQFGGAAGTALFSTILSVAQAGAGEEGTAEFAHASCRRRHMYVCHDDGYLPDWLVLSGHRVPHSRGT